MHKIIIAGGRNFENYPLLKAKCDVILGLLKGQEIQIVIAFWDGQSRGTKNMIDQATSFRLKVRVIKYA